VPDFRDTDSDNDQLLDGDELKAGLNPYSPDSDGDGCGDFNEYYFAGCDMTSNAIVKLPCYDDQASGTISISISSAGSQVTLPTFQAVPERGAPPADFTYTPRSIVPASAGSTGSTGNIDWINDGARLTVTIGIQAGSSNWPNGLYSYYLMTASGGTSVATGRLLWQVEPCPIPK
jgi:hypothetical protein